MSAKIYVGLTGKIDSDASVGKVRAGHGDDGEDGLACCEGAAVSGTDHA